MKIRKNPSVPNKILIELFQTTFANSEGADEGAMIGNLLRTILTQTPPDDRSVFIAEGDDGLSGSCVFSKLNYPNDSRVVYLLSPVAVLTSKQRQGVGQALLRASLETMRQATVDVVVTYGDPVFYGRVGFQQISETQLPAPFPLTYPDGWLAQHLRDEPIEPFKGPAECISAFENPDLW
jgi:putative acetyltransferase